MEIQDIKSNLTLSQILQHYGLKPKNNMLNCPFHEDKTASLQVNLEKQSTIKINIPFKLKQEYNYYINNHYIEDRKHMYYLKLEFQM